MAARKTTTKKVAKKAVKKAPAKKATAAKKSSAPTTDGVRKATSGKKRAYNRKPKAEQVTAAEPASVMQATEERQHEDRVDSAGLEGFLNQLFAEPENPLLDVEVVLFTKEMTFSERMIFMIMLETDGYLSGRHPLSKRTFAQLMAETALCDFEGQDFGLELNHKNKLVTVIPGADVLRRPSYNRLEAISFEAQIGFSEKLFLAPETVTIDGVTYNKAQ